MIGIAATVNDTCSEGRAWKRDADVQAHFDQRHPLRCHACLGSCDHKATNCPGIANLLPLFALPAMEMARAPAFGPHRSQSMCNAQYWPGQEVQAFGQTNKPVRLAHLATWCPHCVEGLVEGQSVDYAASRLSRLLSVSLVTCSRQQGLKAGTHVRITRQCK